MTVGTSHVVFIYVLTMFALCTRVHGMLVVLVYPRLRFSDVNLSPEFFHVGYTQGIPWVHIYMHQKYLGNGGQAAIVQVWSVNKLRPKFPSIY